MAHPSFSIPVAVDAVRTVEDIRMVRVVFLVLAITDASEARIDPSTAAGPDPALLLGGLGVIHRPLTGGDRFQDPDQVAELFTRLDTDDSLIEFEDIWLPESWLHAEHAPERGDVYRIDQRVFRAAYRYRVETLPLAGLMATRIDAGSIVLSPEETDAFRAWNARQIEEARSLYPKDPQRALAYNDQRA